MMRPPGRRLGPALLALGLGAMPLAAQGTPVDSARAAMEAGFAALASQDYLGFARAMHPEALQEFSEMLLPLLTMAAELGEEGELEELLRHFPGVESVEQLAALPPDQLFAGMVRAGMEDAGTTAFPAPAVIGGVLEGDSLVHLVYRLKVATEEAEVTTVSVATLKRGPRGWAMLLTGSADGLAQLLQPGGGEAMEEGFEDEPADPQP